MAQNPLKSWFPPAAQGQGSCSGLEADGFSVISPASWLFPKSYFIVRFRYVALEAQLLNKIVICLYNTHPLPWSGFFNPVIFNQLVRAFPFKPTNYSKFNGLQLFSGKTDYIMINIKAIYFIKHTLMEWRFHTPENLMETGSNELKMECIMYL